MVPISAVDLWKSASEVARSIGSYNDVTYTPAKTIADSGAVRREIIVESKVDSGRADREDADGGEVEDGSQTEGSGGEPAFPT